MLDVFHIAKPQGCDIQTFYGPGTSSAISRFAWSKPRGVSNIYMLLIGGGGNGNGTNGGGSGAVTVWYGSAQNVPDNLLVHPSTGDSSNGVVRYYGSGGQVNLLIANAAVGSTGGTAMTANQFAASGFFQSIAGQAGSTGDQTASATTFLSGGNGPGGVGVITANYGYSHGPGSGFFQLQPIIVGIGGANGSGSRGGIGCGSDASAVAPGATGGPGMVLIASW